MFDCIRQRHGSWSSGVVQTQTPTSFDRAGRRENTPKTKAATTAVPIEPAVRTETPGSCSAANHLTNAALCSLPPMSRREKGSWWCHFVWPT